MWPMQRAALEINSRVAIGGPSGAPCSSTWASTPCRDKLEDTPIETASKS